MRRCLGFVLLLVLVLPAGADDRRRDKTRLKVATFNAEFLWDGRAPEQGDSDFPWKGSPQKAEAHMAELAKVVRALDADLLNLVEVENLAALELFNEKFLAGMGYAAYLDEGIDTATGQDVALLTRIDLSSFGRDNRMGRSGGKKKSVSKNYVAKLVAGGEKLSVIGLHLIAKPSDARRREEREAQADAIRSMALEQAGQGRQVIVLGDFNDLDGEVSDPRAERPISRVLQMIRAMDPATTLDDLLNVARGIPAEKRFTTFVDRNGNGRADGPRELSLIDHILVSRALDTKVLGVDIRQPALADLERVSDHFPIAITLRLP